MGDPAFEFGLAPTDHAADADAIDMPRPRNYVAPQFLALRKEITGIMDSTL